LLQILADSGQGIGFRLSSEGANEHSCHLEGGVNGNEGRAVFPDGVTDEACIITLGVGAHGIEVGVAPVEGNFEACRQYCGMRAGFDGTYLRAPEPCRAAPVRRTRDTFQRLYDSHDYAKAIQTLRPLLQQCGQLLHYRDLDRIHNDLAVAFHHLGQDAECLRELHETGVDDIDEDGLSDRFIGQPGSLETYRPIARATWHNRLVCRGGSEPAK
jgi:hypothetical protein